MLVEIERTLKKVTEGLEIFHETLDKLGTAATPNQKEKVETDLKKEIKKLQRLRDLIKGWQTLSEIKDKQALHDSRRSIETEMERFKILEKEMKIKAFSKEGLNQTTKMDPREKERLELAHWINSAVDRLNTQIDALEAEMEAIQLKGGTSGRQVKERLERLTSLTDRHKFHVRKLELILRLLGNERLEVEEVVPIKEDIEYYIEENQEDDFMENEQVYDDLDLTGGSAAGAFDSSDGESDSDGGADEALEESTTTSTPAEIPDSKTAATKPVKIVSLAAKKQQQQQQQAPQSPAHSTKSPAPIIVVSTATAAQPTSHATVPTAAPPVSPIAGGRNGAPSFASAAATASATTAPPSSTVASPPISFAGAAQQKTAAAVAKTAPLAEPNRSASASPSAVTAQGNPNKHRPFAELALYLEKRQGGRPLSLEQMTAGLEASIQNCPDSHELDRCRSFVPKNPYPDAPSYYPSTVPSILENPTIFERFDLDTLFFIFYYRQKSYAQYYFILIILQISINRYLAARELKRQSWRFHKKYLTWFQRHEEPKTVTDEYEQGTYIYFDYEGSWCQRKKTEFTFEYRYLEDEETV